MRTLPGKMERVKARKLAIEVLELASIAEIETRAGKSLASAKKHLRAIASRLRPAT